MGKWSEDWDSWVPTKYDGYGVDDGLLEWVTIGYKRIPNFIYIYLFKYTTPIQFKAIMGLQLFDMNDSHNLWLCHPSQEQMSELWGVSISSVGRWLNQICDRVKDGKKIEGLVIRRSPKDRGERRRMKKGTQRGLKIFDFSRLSRKAFEKVLGMNYDNFAKKYIEAQAQREYEKAERKRLKAEAIQEAKDDREIAKAVAEGRSEKVEPPSPEEIAERKKNLAIMERHMEEERIKRIEEMLEKSKREKVMEEPPSLEKIMEQIEEAKRKL